MPDNGNIKKIVLVGAGNLATRLGLELAKHGCGIVQVYSRTEASAARLAGVLGTSYTTRFSDIREGQDLYIFALKDDVLPEAVSGTRYSGGLWVHTAGSVDMDIFQGYAGRYGVFYPLQSFSKTRAFDFSKVPVFVEANNKEDILLLEQLGRLISEKVIPMNSEKRRRLHLAAVFASNFTNHLYTLAFGILEKEGIDGALLLPLMEETTAKAHAMHPFDAQTGPALRNDTEILSKHLSLIDDKELRDIYKMLSKHIQKTHRHE